MSFAAFDGGPQVLAATARAGGARSSSRRSRPRPARRSSCATRRPANGSGVAATIRAGDDRRCSDGAPGRQPHDRLSRTGGVRGRGRGRRCGCGRVGSAHRCRSGRCTRARVHRRDVRASRRARVHASTRHRARRHPDRGARRALHPRQRVDRSHNRARRLRDQRAEDHRAIGSARAHRCAARDHERRRCRVRYRVHRAAQRTAGRRCGRPVHAPRERRTRTPGHGDRRRSRRAGRADVRMGSRRRRHVRRHCRRGADHHVGRGPLLVVRRRAVRARRRARSARPRHRPEGCDRRRHH